MCQGVGLFFWGVDGGDGRAERVRLTGDAKKDAPRRLGCRRVGPGEEFSWRRGVTARELARGWTRGRIGGRAVFPRAGARANAREMVGGSARARQIRSSDTFEGASPDDVFAGAWLGVVNAVGKAEAFRGVGGARHVASARADPRGDGRARSGKIRGGFSRRRTCGRAHPATRR